MNLMEAGTRHLLDPNDNYYLEIEEGSHLILVIGATAEHALFNFQHKNMVDRAAHVLEFKHYRDNGSKFWTAKAGVDLYFVVPKEAIEIVPEKRYSYPKVKINGEEVVLNTSGGTFPEKCWTDIIRRQTVTLVNMKVSTVKKIAEVAINREEAEALGYLPKIRYMEAEQRNYWVELAAAPIVRDWLKKHAKRGESNIMVKDNCSVTGPFLFLSQPRRKQYYLCLSPNRMQYKVRYKHINWTDTAIANNIPLPEPC